MRRRNGLRLRPAAIDVVPVPSEDGVLLIPVCAECSEDRPRSKNPEPLRALGPAPTGGDADARGAQQPPLRGSTTGLTSMRRRSGARS